MVVIAEEGDQRFGMWVQAVALQYVHDLLHRRSGDHNLPQCVFQRKIEDGRQSGVDSVELLSSTLKKRSDGRVGICHFSNAFDVWIDLPHALVPTAPEFSR